MANINNLRPKPWAKGQSGNLAGKPKGTKNLSTLLREVLEKEVSATDPFSNKIEKKQIKEVVAIKLASIAMKGNLSAIQTILDRLEGKPKETIDANINKPVPDWVLEMNQPVADNPV